MGKPDQVTIDKVFNNYWCAEAKDDWSLSRMGVRRSRARGDRVGSEKRISVETVIGSKERSSPPPVERRRVDLSRTIAICRPIAPPNSAVLGPVAVMTAAYELFNPAQASVHSTGPRGVNVVAISFKASDR